MYPQPAIDSYGNVLLFNGEIYSAEDYDPSSIDTGYIIEGMAACSVDEEVASFLSALKGPWAVIYWSAARQTLYYGRDRMGRRSLLRASREGKILVASTASSAAPFALEDWSRVSVDGLYFHRFGGLEVSSGTVPWPAPIIIAPPLTHSKWAAHFERHNIAQDGSFAALVMESALGLMDILEEAVRTRVECIRHEGPPRDQGRVAVLFSGGIDCTILAALAHKNLPKEEPIDLINVCFDKQRNHTSPDRLQALECFAELVAAFPSREWRLVLVNSCFEEVKIYAHHILSLCHPNKSHMDFNIGAALWFASRGKGVLYRSQDIRNPAVKNTLKARQHFKALIAEARPQQPDDDSTEDGTDSHLCQAGESCRKVAKARCRHKSCRSCCLRRQHGEDTSCPVHKDKQKNTQRRQKSEPPAHDANIQSLAAYSSRAKVLLNGLGADEQLGGYGRHRQGFKYRGWPGLQKELDLDVARIWSRNLGRDDRCCSDHGKEVRHPYLDEKVMEFIRTYVPLKHKVNYMESRSVGDKRLLRIICHLLGLPGSAMYEKRAIQFGTRLAKLSNINCFGSNRAFDGTVSFQLE